MTTASEDDAPISRAMERAGHALTTGPESGSVFLEDRSDIRLALRPDVGPDLTITRSRGAAVGTRDSFHVTDPDLTTLIELCRRGGRGFATIPGAADRDGPLDAREFDDGWIRSLGSRLTEQAERELRGMSDGRWSATLVGFHQNVWVADGTGTVVKDLRSGCRAEVRVMFERHPNSVATYDCVIGWGSSTLPAGVISEALERADRKRAGLSHLPPGDVCGVMAPGVGGVIIHELVGHALEGDTVLGRKSWLGGPRAPRGPKGLRVADDPRRGRGAWRVDDEGVPSAETVLVEDGRPVGLLLDRETAAAVGKPSTGNGRRSSYLTRTRPRMGCTYIAAGEDEPEDLLRRTPTGVFIRRMTAGHTDPATGRASFIVTEADAIIRGHLGALLAPFVIEVDGPAAWGTIDRVGHDLAFDTCVGSCVREGQPLAVSVGAPTIRIGLMRVVY